MHWLHDFSNPCFLWFDEMGRKIWKIKLFYFSESAHYPMVDEPILFPKMIIDTVDNILFADEKNKIFYYPKW